MNVHLPPFPFWQCLVDFAEPLEAVLLELEQRGRGAEGDVWFGAHRPEVVPPPDAIIFQTEVLSSPWFTDDYRRKLRSARAVWDYSSAHAGAYDCRAWAHVPVRYHSALESPYLQELRRQQGGPGYPLGFFGSVNRRRADVLAGSCRCMAAGFGRVRDAWLARVGAIVVPHFYEGAPVEQARIGFLLANGVPVVAEEAPDQQDFAGPVYVPIDQLIHTAGALHPTAGDEQRAAFKAMGSAHELVLSAIRAS